jgi:hypothetical protein
MDILEKLFDSSARVKLMKLFLFNPQTIFEKKTVIKRAKVASQTATRELALLQKTGMIRKKSFFKDGEVLKSGKVTNKKRVKGFIVNKDFKYLIQMKNLLVNTSPMTEGDILKRVSRYGKIKLVVTSGVFIQDSDSRIDILIVGDNLKERSLKTTISTMESEIGRQLRYVIFTTKDFNYRMGICDRLVRDILDYPHQTIVDRIGV